MRYPAVGSAIISLLTLGSLLVLRFLGYLQRPELIFYDDFVRRRAAVAGVSANPHIVICAMDEKDLRKYGHPLNDPQLATLLRRIHEAGAVAIGLDLYRDLQEPRSGEYYAELETALRELDNVVAIERIPGIGPPPSIADRPERFAPNNIPVDYQFDGSCRRAYLFLEGPHFDPRESLALALVHTYLAAGNVEVALEEQPDGGPALLRLGRTVFPRLTANAGAYFGVVLQGYEIMVDFRVSGGFRHVTYRDVLESASPLDVFKDAIVIVGVSADSVKDSNATPLDPRLRGAEHHAIIVDQLLRSALHGSPPTRWWSEPAKIAWIGFCTLLGGVFGLVMGSPWRLAPALLALLASILYAGWFALLHGLWIPITTPALGAFAAATFVTSLVVYFDSVDRRAMRALFSRHVSGRIMDALWAEREQFMDGGRLKSRRVTATVLFTDLKNYSTMSEEMEPADLLNWNNECLNRIAPQVDAHGGIVTGYRGDGMMAVFGVPIPRETEEEQQTDARQAVACAMAMRQNLKQLNAEWAARGAPTASMRVGIYTGPVVIGSMGSKDRLEYAVLGDTTNTAARLETLGKELPDEAVTPPCTILIGESTRRCLEANIVTKSIGPKRLKGKANEVIVHIVL